MIEREEGGIDVIDTSSLSFVEGVEVLKRPPIHDDVVDPYRLPKSKGNAEADTISSCSSTNVIIISHII